MGRSISEDEAIEAAWNVQLPTLRLDMPLSSNNGFKQLQAERGDKAYADMGVWLQLCSLATSYKGHALRSTMRSWQSGCLQVEVSRPSLPTTSTRS